MMNKPKSILLQGITTIQLAIYMVLMLFLICIVIYSVYYYALHLIQMFNSTVFTGESMLYAFAFFLLILIGLELMDSIKSFITTHKVNVSIFITLALIAVCRKIIVIDLSESDFTELIGIGVVIFALASGYYLLKKADFNLNGESEVTVESGDEPLKQDTK